MNSLSIVLLVAAGIVVASMAWWVWEDRVRRLPLSHFGLESLRRIGRFESASWRERVWQRGWLTSAEWRAINRRQLRAIEAELARRVEQ